MYLKVIRDNVQFRGIDERIMEISINDTHNIYIRAWVYEKLNSGEYILLKENAGFKIKDSNNDFISKLTNIIF